MNIVHISIRCISFCHKCSRMLMQKSGVSEQASEQSPETALITWRTSVAKRVSKQILQ